MLKLAKLAERRSESVRKLSGEGLQEVDECRTGAPTNVAWDRNVRSALRGRKAGRKAGHEDHFTVQCSGHDSLLIFQRCRSFTNDAFPSGATVSLFGSAFLEHLELSARVVRGSSSGGTVWWNGCDSYRGEELHDVVQAPRREAVRVVR